jgi:hypothetical protein
MATWVQVREMLLGITSFNFELESENVVSVRIPTEGGRDQRVYVCNEGDSVCVISAICKLEAIDLNKLFAAPFMRDLPFGFGVMTDHLAIRHLQLLESLDVPEVTKPIIRVAHLADSLERKLIEDDIY